MLNKGLYILVLITGLILGGWTVGISPVKAQEDLDTILARAAAKNFLATITRTELMDSIEFYLVDDLRVEGLLSTLSNVNNFTVTGDGWLGIAPSGREITMRSLDFWRCENGRIRENWVLVDLLHVYAQIGVDVFSRMREKTYARQPAPPAGQRPMTE